MTNTQLLTESDDAAISDLLVGRRIVAAESDLNERVGYEIAHGRLVLDDGTEILVAPNEGGCACGAGDYTLEHLATVDNIITGVRLVDETTDDYDAHRYQIFVVADAVEINALTVEGDDGNGYYGTGYSLIVKRPEVGA